MGLSSSKSSTTPWQQGQPYLLGAANATQDAYQGNAGNIQNYTNQVTSLIPSLAQKYQEGNPATNAQQNYITSTLGSDYTQSPYLQGMLDQTNNAVRNETAGALGSKGLTGGSDYTRLIAQAVAKNDAGMRYQDYNNWQNTRAQAAGMAPSNAAADVINISPLLSTLQASMTPIQAASGYSGAIGGLLSPYQTTTQPNGLLNSLIGAGSSLGSAAILASDERLKEDIRPLGKTHGGLEIFTYRYKGDPKLQVGVMAQEVAEKQPDALGPTIGGYMTVDYGKVR